jgi:hypothetical protein
MLQTNKNQQCVNTLDKILPDRRDKLTPGLLWKLRLDTGFSNVEIFRKCAAACKAGKYRV